MKWKLIDDEFFEVVKNDFRDRSEKVYYVLAQNPNDMGWQIYPNMIEFRTEQSFETGNNVLETVLFDPCECLENTDRSMLRVPVKNFKESNGIYLRIKMPELKSNKLLNVFSDDLRSGNK